MADGSDSDEETRVLQLEFERVLDPYGFEPMVGSRSVVLESCEPGSSDEDSDPVVPQVPNHGPNTVEQWCNCGRCGDMPAAAERICCQYYTKMQTRMADNEPVAKCITQTYGFEGNCLNPHVLEVSLYDVVQHQGAFGDAESHSSLMRHVAYRRLVRWVFGILGKNVRVPLPACAVLKIRERFPSDFYHGFTDSIY